MTLRPTFWLLVMSAALLAACGDAADKPTPTPSEQGPTATPATRFVPRPRARFF